jgi:hypothetical protein
MFSDEKPFSSSIAGGDALYSQRHKGKKKAAWIFM